MEIIEGEDGESPLPDEVLQHIHSYMTRKEAARTTILSKSWRNAWLTRPVLDFDSRDFYTSQAAFRKFTTKTMLRYRYSDLKIESFKLHNNSSHDIMGYVVPLLVSCPMLKSLTLEHVGIRSDDMFKDIISCCTSMEELSLSYCSGLFLSETSLSELHKLRRLHLELQRIDNMFFTRFDSRFPCLKDLSILQCQGCTRVRIASTSLQTISFMPINGSQSGKFDVPNIRKFTYSGHVLPAILFIEGASREWEFDVLISIDRFQRTLWFLKLKKELTKFRLSRISLALILECEERSEYWLEVDIEVVPEPLTVENLVVGAPTMFRPALLLRLLGIFRPNFITDHHWLGAHCDLWNRYEVAPIDIFGKKLIQLLFTSFCRNLFRQLGLKKVKAEVYECFGTEWRPLVPEELEASKTPANYRKIRLQLTWKNFV